MYQFLASASSSKYVMRLLALKVSAGLLCDFFLKKYSNPISARTQTCHEVKACVS